MGKPDGSKEWLQFRNKNINNKMDRKANFDHSQHRKGLSKSLIPLRNNNIRTTSVNLTNQFCAPKVASKALTYYLGKGNNEAIVRKVMECRPNWVESTDSTSAFVNLKWQQDQRGYRYSRLVDSAQYRTVVNHFQHHAHLSNKQFLFRNLEKYCAKTPDADLWKIVPPTFILNCKDQCCMQSLKMYFDYYTKHFPKALKERLTPAEVEKQIYNERRKLRFFFFNSNLKKVMAKNPPMLDVYVNRDEGDYLWIVKPTFLNRGRGIEVFSRISELTKFVTDNISGYLEKKLGGELDDSSKKIQIDYIKRNSEAARYPVPQEKQPPASQVRKQQMEESEESTFDGNQFIRIIPNGPSLIKTDCFLIQKYLQRPLLIQNRKFDIRTYVLVTHTQKCYWFPEGYVRLSSSEYNCKSSKEGNFVHLTNNAVQKFSSDYGKLAEGNQMSFKQLRATMQEHNLSFTDFTDKMQSFITHSLNATIKKLNSEARKFSFEIFGYDFMIDINGHPWLIQVNTNPCLEESSPILKCLLPRMLDDAFKLTIDNLFFGSSSTGNFPVENYSSDNMWVCLPVST